MRLREVRLGRGVFLASPVTRGQSSQTSSSKCDLTQLSIEYLMNTEATSTSQKEQKSVTCGRKNNLAVLQAIVEL